MKKYTGPNGEKRTRVKLSELPEISPERLAEIASLRDEDIDYSDIPYQGPSSASGQADPEVLEFATIGWPPPKKLHLTIRLDEDVVEFFKERGQRYQSRINAVLRAYVEAQRRAETEKAKVSNHA